ncbi:MAG: putative Ig domain-containing protein [Acidobacteria bacterium]|nr:putative Ig domain-containing protein [Acidobacteriota bacterium]
MAAAEWRHDYYDTDQVIDLKGDKATEKLKKRLTEAQAKWTSVCTGGVPMSSGPGAGAPAGAEVWTIKRGTYTELLDAETAADHDARKVCGKAFRDDRVIHLYNHSRCNSGEAARTGLLAHELGHPMRLGDVIADASCASIMKSPTAMDAAASLAVDPTNDCTAVKREETRPPSPPGGGGNPDDGGTNPGGGANPNPDCTANPDDLRCEPDCTLNPKAPGCPEVTYGPECFGKWEDKNGNGEIDEGECDPYALSTPPGSGSVTTTHAGVSSSRSYVIGLRAESVVTVSLTKMTRDFDCKGEAGNLLATNEDAPDAATPGGSGPGPWRCSNRGGRSDDSWSGKLPAGDHTITVWPWGTGGAGDYTLSVTIAEKLIPPPPLRTLPFTVSETNVSGKQWYRFSLSSDAGIKMVVSDQSTDIDCRIDGRLCRNHAGTADEIWSGALKSGNHTVTVWPYRGAGSYKLTVTPSDTATPTPTPSPTPPTPPPSPPSLVCPVVSDFRLPSGGTMNTVLPEATGGSAPYTYGLSGRPPGISFVSSTRVASGTLPRITVDTDYTVTYHCRDSAAASASSTFLVRVLAPAPPAAPTLTGSVVGRTQTLTWTEPAGGGITRYQLQTRASSAHTWRFTGAGSPSPSSNIGPNARSWSVLTPWTLYRQYRVRATNGAGDGAWSNVVALRTPSAPPPPLIMPTIPNFPSLPSGGRVNTPFPAVSGGTAPYSYRLSGLPPGLSFTPSTRMANGTLPTVRRATTYRITYSASDSSGRSGSVSFTVTVVP